ncbi:MAG: (Fe-S)-binding protein [candidate division WOR-3 bacterium]
MNSCIPRAVWTCIDCGKCTAVCPVARTGLGFSPRSFIQRAVRKNTDSALYNRALFACLACDRCRTVCMSGISFAELTKELRAAARTRGALGQPAHSGVLQIMMRMMARSDRPQNRLAWLDGSVRTNSKSDVIYFTGCAPYFEPVFGYLAVQPLRTALNAIRLLNLAGIEPNLLVDERCCGHDLLWQGDIQNFRLLAERNLKIVRESGARLVVFSCPECLRTFRLDYRRNFGELGFETAHITEVLVNRIRPSALSLQPRAGKTRVTFQDPCRLGLHLGIFDPPRRLLETIPGLELVEMEHNREQATCCGGTCWIECGPAVKRLQEQRLAEACATGANRIVTACPKCDIHLRCATASIENVPAVQNIVDILADTICDQGGDLNA